MRIQMNRNRNGEALTNNQLQQFAPSAFAGQAHESRSNRYTFLPTIDVIDGMRNAGFQPVAAMQSRSRIAGKALFTKHQIRFRSADQSMTQVGDTAVEALMTNSHDGTSSYLITLGAFRLACLNGMVVSEGMVESFRVNHTGNIISRVIEATASLLEQAPKVVEAIKNWKQIVLAPSEQLILAESALALRFDDQAPVTADSLLSVRRTADNQNDLWSVFNRVQEATIRGGLRYRTEARTDENNNFVPSRRMRTHEVKSIDQNTKLNRELWALAEKMAALKA